MGITSRYNSENLLHLSERVVSINRSLLKLTGVELVTKQIWQTTEPVASKLADYAIQKAITLIIPEVYPGIISNETDE